MDRQSSKELLMTSDRLILAFLIIIALWLCQEKGVADDSFCMLSFYLNRSMNMKCPNLRKTILSLRWHEKGQKRTRQVGTFPLSQESHNSMTLLPYGPLHEMRMLVSRKACQFVRQ